MARTPPGAVRYASTLSLPPHLPQANTSSAKLRRSSPAQVSPGVRSWGGSNELLYQFTVDDPVHYTQAWSGEYSFKPAKGQIYEYACHEGNYAMEGILRGARLAEGASAKTANRAGPP
jgi:hypothetical protein